MELGSPVARLTRPANRFASTEIATQDRSCNQRSPREETSTPAQNRSAVGILNRERIIATAGFNRWLVPPAALAIHLCIGMAYGFSVFWLPLTHAIGLNQSVPCAADTTLFSALLTTSCDWKVSDLGWMYTLFFVFLGSSAALWGGWLERVGPRKAGVVSALCWCGGLWISAVGVATHQLWLMWLGSGVIGGVGVGLIARAEWAGKMGHSGTFWDIFRWARPRWVRFAPARLGV